MKHQSNSQSHGHLVSSVEEGISLIKEGSTKAILGGRETLYFNMKRYGEQNILLLQNEIVNCFDNVYRDAELSNEWETVHKVFSGGCANRMSIFGEFKRSVWKKSRFFSAVIVLKSLITRQVALFRIKIVSRPTNTPSKWGDRTHYSDSKKWILLLSY